MRLNWKWLRLILLPALLLLAAGCGGIQATKSVSPASFLIPGFLKADPQPQTPPDNDLPTGEHAHLVAQS